MNEAGLVGGFSILGNYEPWVWSPETGLTLLNGLLRAPDHLGFVRSINNSGQVLLNAIDFNDGSLAGSAVDDHRVIMDGGRVLGSA